MIKYGLTYNQPYSRDLPHTRTDKLGPGLWLDAVMDLAIADVWGKFFCTEGANVWDSQV